MKITTDAFIKKAKSVYGDKYDYSKVEYININTRVSIICPTHGEFTIFPEYFLKNGCPYCKKEKKRSIKQQVYQERFIEKAKQIHGDKYDYSKVKYVNTQQKVCIICPQHGEFWQTPAHHLSGEGCPKCALGVITQTDFIKRAQVVHNNQYDYSKVHYVNKSIKVDIICKKHGVFSMTPTHHLDGEGCPKCALERAKQRLLLDNNTFIQKAKLIHGNYYDYSKVSYKDATTKVCIICPKHGEFWQTPNNHVNNYQGCPKCTRQRSKWEDELSEWILKQGIVVQNSVRDIIKNNEIDIFLPNYRIGIECDGLYWHSDKFRDKNYHLDKTMKCREKDIRLIHIFEDEWIYKKDILKSMILNILGRTEKKIYARKCKIKNVSASEKNNFLDANHVQGKCNSAINLGLYYNGVLVSLMTFHKPRIGIGNGKGNEGEYELTRFCSLLKTEVIGAASKLFKYFIKVYKPVKITTYADKRWSNGNLYFKLGFTHDHDSPPNYFYVNQIHRENRFRYRKSVLVKEGFDKNKSEREIMQERGFHRIYDCGTMVFVYQKAN